MSAMHSNSASPYAGAWRFSVAPMMDWTDRHCRYFHRLLSQRALLYTEMVTTGALLHGDQARHLDYSAEEQPLALQLGGSEPADLATCARLAQQWGYQEVNLNCGCPSERVQKGAFGACLMKEPLLVAQSVRAMREACDLPITVKHRIGLGRNDDYGFLRDFVGEVARAGCDLFIVHARNAWLEGLSPKENRDIPPLRYNVLNQLKRDFPSCRFVLNGGLKTHHQVQSLRDEGIQADGVMFGRAAYENPSLLAQVDSIYFSQNDRYDVAIADLTWRHAVVEQWIDYAVRQEARGVPARTLTRHVLGLYQGLPGARLWRRELSAGQWSAQSAPKALAAALRLVPA